MSSEQQPLNEERRKAVEHSLLQNKEAKVAKTWLDEQTEIIGADNYEDFKNESESVWISLPHSVIGTLIYFVLVEQNSPFFKPLHVLKAYLVIGLPTLLCYMFQIVMIMELWNSVYGENGANGIADGICAVDPLLLVASVGVFIFNMLPSFMEWITCTDIILFCKRCAYTQQASDEHKVWITNLLAISYKRAIIFVFVNLLEGFVILALCYAGVGFLLSSGDINDVLLNSVSVIFILQIDDMARDAFQPDQVSDHIDGMEFETTFNIAHVDNNNMSRRGTIRPPTHSTFKTFSSAFSAVATFVAACFCVYPMVWKYCPTEL